MLSYNYSILKKSWNNKSLNKKNLIQILGVFFLDMFSITLYISYSIYYRPVILPAIDIFTAKLILSGLLIFIQLGKSFGFLYFYRKSAYR